MKFNFIIDITNEEIINTWIYMRMMNKKIVVLPNDNMILVNYKKYTVYTAKNFVLIVIL